VGSAPGKAPAESALAIGLLGTEETAPEEHVAEETAPEEHVFRIRDLFAAELTCSPSLSSEKITIIVDANNMFHILEAKILDGNESTGSCLRSDWNEMKLRFERLLEQFAHCNIELVFVSETEELGDFEFERKHPVPFELDPDGRLIEKWNFAARTRCYESWEEFKFANENDFGGIIAEDLFTGRQGKMFNTVDFRKVVAHGQEFEARQSRANQIKHRFETARGPSTDQYILTLSHQ